MIKRILVLASQRKKSQEAISFFSKYPCKFKISALMCTDEKQLDFFKKQIKELQPDIVFFPNKNSAEQITDEFNIKCYSDYLQYNQFLKDSNSDLVVSDLVGIDSVRLILATIGEYKDICHLNLEPILYSGKIIINEAKNKGVKQIFITHQFYSLDIFLKYKSSLENTSYVILTSYDTEYDKENLDYYTYPSKPLSEFKKIYYFKNKMWLSRHLFVFNHFYDLGNNKYEYYKSNTDSLSVILQQKNGSNCMTLINNNKELIYNFYFLDNSVDTQPKLEKTIDIKLQKIKREDIPSLNLATTALQKGGSYPILFQMCYDLCTDAIYYNKSKDKNLFFKVFEEVLEDRSFYSKNRNIQTIFALYEKLKIKIETEHLKKTKDVKK